MKSHVLALVSALLASAAHSSEIAATDIEAPGDNVTAIITPTRLKQPLQDVPASVTVISAEMLRRYAITNVPDALRLVPGMAVTRNTGSSYTINYHGTNSRSGRRMNVLIDGISVYQPGLSEIDWAQLPIAIEDIERIEVTRSPNSATYGPNSMLATINIITKDSSDTPTGQASMGSGSNRQRHVYGRVSGTFGDTTAYLSMSRDSDTGYSTISNAPGPHDSTAVSRLLLRSKTAIDAATTLTLQAAYSAGTSEVPLTSTYEEFPDKDLRNYSLGATLTKRLSDRHELQVRASYAQFSTTQEWATCFPKATYLPQLFDLYTLNPSYANTLLTGRIPSGGTPLDNAQALQAAQSIRALGSTALQPFCGVTNANVRQSRSEFELQDTYVASGQLRIIAGGGGRVQKADSQTYLGGSVSDTLFYGFATAEYKPSVDWTINLGGYVEDDRLSATTFAPRAALNYHVSPNQTLRFVVSKGIRTPDIMEQRGDISYTLKPYVVSPGLSSTPRFYQNSQSVGSLEAERIVSREIGYMLNLPERGLMLDVKAFSDQLRDLISQPVTVTSFRPNNDNSVNISGIEAKLNYKFSPDLSGFANYAYLRNQGATDPIEAGQYSRNSGAIGLSRDLAGGLQLTSAYYGASGNSLGLNEYGRLDLILTKTFFAAQHKIEGRIRLSRLNNPTTSYYRGTGFSLGSSSYGDRLQAYADIRLFF
ncbi:Outer membrane cobalamin translocator [Variovorax sp. SRS16]|uniref:TonB-dependent receptor plug domain-containing protein n=1 Tax=Variovorax sp. SRS16 TaxID=282217 RepID=UPI001317193E|nr:TonB-dependent receptor [Variovorax sp. SRS16]VTU19875.1 Outer membrane cobalamin translocator [Variovorax sp. SRS16]